MPTPPAKSAHVSWVWYLTAIATIKDEAANIEEWLAFCVSEGVEHILLYDTGSSDNTREVLEPWIRAGIVELLKWTVPWKQGAQTKAYTDALRRFRGRSRWVAFIDPDEFVFSPTGLPVAEVLRAYEGYAGVVVNWQCYGSSGHSRRPTGLTIETYTRRARSDWARNRRVKTIVDPLLAMEPLGSHLFKVEPGHTLVTEDFTPVRVIRSVKWRRSFQRAAAQLPYLPFDPYSTRRPSRQRISVSRLRINHYVTRSAEDVAVKYKDRGTMGERDRRVHARYHDRNEIEDPVLVSQAGLVREVIERVRAAKAPFALHQWAMQKRKSYAFDALRTSASAEVAAERRTAARRRSAVASHARFQTPVKRVVGAIRRDVLILWLAARDRRVPWYAKLFAAVTGAYPVWPIDLIPDVVPVLGYVDDVIIVSLGLLVAAQLIPATVMADLRTQASRL